MQINELEKLGIIPIDYSVLKSMLTGYSMPRHKITALEQSEHLIRLKKGLYVVSPNVSKRRLITELIANHIYGPSYVSMESALRYYGLIPESVYTVKSMTLKRSRSFENTIAKFDYTHCSCDYYSVGLNLIENTDYSFIIASPEKALCDLIAYTPKLKPRFVKSTLKFLEEDLRLDMDEFYKMNIEIFKSCAKFSKKRVVIENIIKLLER